MSEKAIEIKNLTKSFKNLQVLKGVNLHVEKGTMLALLGPNGAGKTTIVRILSTLIKPDAGEIYVNGFNVVKQADEVRHTIGLTGQYAAVDEFLSGRENLVMMGRLYHLGKEQSILRAQELLVQFDLVESADRQVKNYSGGMRRRLDLASSLVAVPPIIFLDEPTTGLDPRSRIAMWTVIEDLKKNGATILLTTQYLEEADQLADRIAVLDHGKVIAEGTANQLKGQVGNERLEVIIAKGHDFAKALEIIGKDRAQANEEERTISITTDGTVKAVRKVLEDLDKVGIDLDGMQLQKPTLDDVFLKLTGHGATHGEAVDAANPTVTTH